MACSFDAAIRRAQQAARRSLPGAAVAIGLLLGTAACREPVEQLVAQAATLREAGNIRGAATKLDAALEQQPNNIPARLLAAQLYIDLERGDAALGLLTRIREDGVDRRQIVKLWTQAEYVAQRYQEVLDDTADIPEELPGPVRASLLAYRGGALGALGQATAAQHALEDGRAADPQSVDVRVTAGRLAIDRGDIDEARGLLAAASRTAPNDRRVKQLEADIAYAAGEYPAAERLYRQMLELAPWNEPIRGQLAAIQVAEDKPSEAISTVDAVLLDPQLRNVPKHPLLNYVRALAAFRLKDYATAQSNAAVVVAKVPGFERARLMAGASSYALKAYEQAYYYLSPYVAEHPGDIAARKLLAATQLRLGRGADAESTLNPVKNDTTDDIELLQLIGEASAHDNDLPTAIRYLGLALKQEPGDGILRTQLGIAQLAAGDPQAAIENLELVAAAHPEASLPEISLFAAFLQTRDYNRALAAAERLKKAEPSKPTGELLTAAVYLHQGRLRAGREALLRAREIRPGDIAANDTLARLALAAGRADIAREYFQDILNANPASTGTYIALAELESKTGHAAAAEAVLLKGAQAAAASDPGIAVALARLQLTLGESKKALGSVTEALKKNPRNPALLETAGNAQLALGESDNALSTFKNLVDIAPDLASAHIGLAKAYLALFTPDHPQWSAVNEAMQAVSLAPEDIDAKLVLARALALHGRFAQATDLIRELQRLKPRDAEVIEIAALIARGQGLSSEASAAAARAGAVREGTALRGEAELQSRRGEPDRAAKSLADWLDAHPEDDETRKMLAEIWVNTGHLAKAHAEYRQLAEREPKNAGYQNNLAWVLTRLGRWQEALPHARSAVSLEPGSVEFLDTLGMILLQAGDSGEALSTLQAAWNKAADRPDIAFHYSQALAMAGRNDEALSVLRRILNDRDPAFAERDQARILLQRLGG
ncbi:MAG: XrtA/PEP-CTERM system TPR-repeat protein PrsT [Alphaproteobacteria bacterium]